MGGVEERKEEFGGGDGGEIWKPQGGKYEKSAPWFVDVVLYSYLMVIYDEVMGRDTTQKKRREGSLATSCSLFIHLSIHLCLYKNRFFQPQLLHKCF